MLKSAKAGGGLPVINLIISANQTNVYNAFTAAGSPAYACQLIITVNSGIVCQQGISITGFHTASSATLFNNGTIAGTGGVGVGGINVSTFEAGYPDYFYVDSTIGGAGGHAINTTLNLAIDNTSGYIFGGGGGGGGGRETASGNYAGYDHWDWSLGSGGGGGGRGYNNAAGGQKSLGGFWQYSGDGTPKPPVDGFWTASVQPAAGYPSAVGNDGSSGSSAAAGAGGAGCTADAGNIYAPGAVGGAGGNGGDWGADGQQGGSTTNGSGVPGGPAGNAVKLNGKSVTWLGGNNGTQVKGPVS